MVSLRNRRFECFGPSDGKPLPPIRLNSWTHPRFLRRVRSEGGNPPPQWSDKTMFDPNSNLFDIEVEEVEMTDDEFFALFEVDEVPATIESVEDYLFPAFAA